MEILIFYVSWLKSKPKASIKAGIANQQIIIIKNIMKEIKYEDNYLLKNLCILYSKNNLIKNNNIF